MISGECRVESLSPSDSKVLIDGLRLRLDLRIVPGEAGADAAAAAVWRIENPAVTTLRLGVPVAYRRAAIASGIGALALAMGVWLFGPSSSDSERPRSDSAHEGAAQPLERAAPARVAPRSIEPVVAPTPPVPSSSATPSPAAAPGGPAAPLPVTPPASPAPAAPAVAAAPGPAAPASNGVVPPRAARPAAGSGTGRATATTAGVAAAPAAAGSSSPPLTGDRPLAEMHRPVARGRVSLSAAREQDMLELFGDPK